MSEPPQPRLGTKHTFIMRLTLSDTWFWTRPALSPLTPPAGDIAFQSAFARKSAYYCLRDPWGLYRGLQVLLQHQASTGCWGYPCDRAIRNQAHGLGSPKWSCT